MFIAQYSHSDGRPFVNHPSRPVYLISMAPEHLHLKTCSESSTGVSHRRQLEDVLSMFFPLHRTLIPVLQAIAVSCYWECFHSVFGRCIHVVDRSNAMFPATCRLRLEEKEPRGRSRLCSMISFHSILSFGIHSPRRPLLPFFVLSRAFFQ